MKWWLAIAVVLLVGCTQPPPPPSTPQQEIDTAFLMFQSHYRNSQCVSVSYNPVTPNPLYSGITYTDGVCKYRIEILPGGLKSGEWLGFVIAHESGHVWDGEHPLQRQAVYNIVLAGGWDQLKHDLFGNNPGPSEGLADCMARIWGYVEPHYWDCPNSVEEQIKQVYGL